MYKGESNRLCQNWITVRMNKEFQQLGFYLESLSNLDRYYSENCYFKDPFNELHSRKDLFSLYEKMFKKLRTPRFYVTKCIENEYEVVLFWDFRFNANFEIKGSSLLILDHSGKITSHVDYWDTVGEIWQKVPVIGLIIRLFYKIF